MGQTVSMAGPPVFSSASEATERSVGKSGTAVLHRRLTQLQSRCHACPELKQRQKVRSLQRVPCVYIPCTRGALVTVTLFYSSKLSLHKNKTKMGHAAGHIKKECSESTSPVKVWQCGDPPRHGAMGSRQQQSALSLT